MSAPGATFKSFRLLGSTPDTGISNVLVQVTDAAGREAIQAYAISMTVRPEPPPPVVEDSGCSAVGGSWDTSRIT